MSQKKILILFGHSDPNSFICGLADSYEKGARDAGFVIERINLGDLKFDPILHNGYRVIQPLEPDLKMVQEKMRWCDHLVIFYPNWWGTMPALLKGLFDRMFLPGFAFKFSGKGFGGMGWEKLLKGRSACVYITMNTLPWMARILYGDNSNEIKSNILEFAGFSPVKIHKLGPTEKMDEGKRKNLLEKMNQLGKEGH